jgi:hypothetical protein
LVCKLPEECRHAPEDDKFEQDGRLQEGDSSW